MKVLYDFFLNNFSCKGTIIVVISLLPSTVMVFFPPVNQSKIQGKIPLTILEITGRIAIIFILLFAKNSFERKIDIWFILMCIFGLIYYVGWIRFFFSGRTYELLYKPLFFIPIPLAIFPILAFTFAAIWGRNIFLGIAVFVMAVGHIPQSCIYYSRIKNKLRREE